jgi:Flp pilus assembly protein TadG
MNKRARLFCRDERGIAATEFALVLPLLLVTLFGLFDAGRLMLAKSIMDTAVADSARFAARLPMSCAGLTNASDVTRVQILTRTGQSSSGGTALINGWSTNSSVTVTVACLSNTTGGLVGSYDNMLNVPYVTVSATVPFNWTVGALLNVSATNMAASARQPWTG